MQRSREITALTYSRARNISTIKQKKTDIRETLLTQKYRMASPAIGAELQGRDVELHWMETKSHEEVNSEKSSLEKHRIGHDHVSK